MKAVILAGGRGTRLAEETVIRPKPLVEVGGMPILWHIFKIYSSFGINDFIVCCGYKGYMIKEYFANYFLHTSDVTFHMDVGNHMEVHQRTTEPGGCLRSGAQLPRCWALLFCLWRRVGRCGYGFCSATIR